MASEKNITMRQYNGTDYDTLYPKTIASQVEGVYNKTEILTATTAELLGGDNTMLPDEAFKALFEKITVYKELAVYDVAGSYEFVVPKNITHLLAFIISGGSSGSACHVERRTSSNYSYLGGSSGTIELFASDEVTEGDVFAVVVGAGGDGVVSKEDSVASGKAGGSSSFGGTVASGTLMTGKAATTEEKPTSSDIQSADVSKTSMPMRTMLAISLMAVFYRNNKLLSNLSAGGSVGVTTYSGASLATPFAETSTTFPNGKKSSAGAAVSRGSATAKKGTDFGCGGGAAIAVGSGYTAKSADGMNGVVAVWGY